VAPIFLALVTATFEGSLLMNAQATIDNATREGARAGALCGASQGNFSYRGVASSGGGFTGSPCPDVISQVVKKNMGILGVTINPANPVITTTTSAVCPATYCAPQGSVIQVVVTYKYTFYLGALLNGNPSMRLSSTARSVSEQ
jgi:hypothetical protein